MTDPHDPARVRELAEMAQVMDQPLEVRNETAAYLRAYAAAIPKLERLARIERVLECVGDDELIVWQSVEDGDDGPHNPDYLAEIEGEYGKGDTPLAAVLALADALAAQEAE